MRNVKGFQLMGEQYVRENPQLFRHGAGPRRGGRSERSQPWEPSRKSMQVTISAEECPEPIANSSG